MSDDSTRLILLIMVVLVGLSVCAIGYIATIKKECQVDCEALGYEYHNPAQSNVLAAIRCHCWNEGSDTRHIIWVQQ